MLRNPRSFFLFALTALALSPLPALAENSCTMLGERIAKRRAENQGRLSSDQMQKVLERNGISAQKPYQEAKSKLDRWLDSKTKTGAQQVDRDLAQELQSFGRTLSTARQKGALARAEEIVSGSGRREAVAAKAAGDGRVALSSVEGGEARARAVAEIQKVREKIASGKIARKGDAESPELFKSAFEKIQKDLQEIRTGAGKSDPVLNAYAEQLNMQVLALMIDTKGGRYPYEQSVDFLRQVERFYELTGNPPVVSKKISVPVDPKNIDAVVAKILKIDEVETKKVLQEPGKFFDNMKARIETQGRNAKTREFDYIVDFIEAKLSSQEHIDNARKSPLLAALREDALAELQKLRDRGYPYADSLDAFDRVMGVFEVSQRAFPKAGVDLPPLYHARRWKYHENFLKADVPNQLPWPTVYTLTMEDLMAVRGHPISFVWILPEPAWADGHWQSSLEILIHDYNHSRRMWQHMSERAAELGMTVDDYRKMSDEFIKESFAKLAFRAGETQEERNLKILARVILFEVWHEEALPADRALLAETLKRPPMARARFVGETLSTAEPTRVDKINVTASPILALVFRKIWGDFYDMSGMRLEEMGGPQFRTQEWVAKAATYLSKELGLDISPATHLKHVLDESGYPADLYKSIEKRIAEFGGPPMLRPEYDRMVQEAVDAKLAAMKQQGRKLPFSEDEMKQIRQEASKELDPKPFVRNDGPPEVARNTGNATRNTADGRVALSSAEGAEKSAAKARTLREIDGFINGGENGKRAGARISTVSAEELKAAILERRTTAFKPVRGAGAPDEYLEGNRLAGNIAHAIYWDEAKVFDDAHLAALQSGSRENLLSLADDVQRRSAELHELANAFDGPVIVAGSNRAKNPAQFSWSKEAEMIRDKATQYRGMSYVLREQADSGRLSFSAAEGEAAMSAKRAKLIAGLEEKLRAAEALPRGKATDAKVALLTQELALNRNLKSNIESALAATDRAEAAIARGDQQLAARERVIAGTHWATQRKIEAKLAELKAPEIKAALVDHAVETKLISLKKDAEGLRKMARTEPFDPEAFAAQMRQSDGVMAKWLGKGDEFWSGTEMGTDGQHMIAVNKRLEAIKNQLNLEGVKLPGKNPPGTTTTEFMRVLASVHDLAKHKAVQLRAKGAQHDFIIPAVTKVMAELGYSRELQELAISLIKNDALGSMMIKVLSAKGEAEAIYKARHAELIKANKLAEAGKLEQGKTAFIQKAEAKLRAEAQQRAETAMREAHKEYTRPGWFRRIKFPEENYAKLEHALYGIDSSAYNTLRKSVWGGGEGATGGVLRSVAPEYDALLVGRLGMQADSVASGTRVAFSAAEGGATKGRAGRTSFSAVEDATKAEKSARAMLADLEKTTAKVADWHRAKTAEEKARIGAEIAKANTRNFENSLEAANRAEPGAGRVMTIRASDAHVGGNSDSIDDLRAMGVAIQELKQDLKKRYPNVEFRIELGGDQFERTQAYTALRAGLIKHFDSLGTAEGKANADLLRGNKYASNKGQRVAGVKEYGMVTAQDAANMLRDFCGGSMKCPPVALQHYYETIAKSQAGIARDVSKRTGVPLDRINIRFGDHDFISGGNNKRFMDLQEYNKLSGELKAAKKAGNTEEVARLERAIDKTITPEGSSLIAKRAELGGRSIEDDTSWLAKLEKQALPEGHLEEFNKALSRAMGQEVKLVDPTDVEVRALASGWVNRTSHGVTEAAGNVGRKLDEIKGEGLGVNLKAIEQSGNHIPEDLVAHIFSDTHTPLAIMQEVEGRLEIVHNPGAVGAKVNGKSTFSIQGPDGRLFIMEKEPGKAPFQLTQDPRLVMQKYDAEVFAQSQRGIEAVRQARILNDTPSDLMAISRARMNAGERVSALHRDLMDFERSIVAQKKEVRSADAAAEQARSNLKQFVDSQQEKLQKQIGRLDQKIEKAEEKAKSGWLASTRQKAAREAERLKGERDQLENTIQSMHAAARDAEERLDRALVDTFAGRKTRAELQEAINVARSMAESLMAREGKKFTALADGLRGLPEDQYLANVGKMMSRGMDVEAGDFHLGQRGISAPNARNFNSLGKWVEGNWESINSFKIKGDLLDYTRVKRAVEAACKGGTICQEGAERVARMQAAVIHSILDRMGLSEGKLRAKFLAENKDLSEAELVARVLEEQSRVRFEMGNHDWLGKKIEGTFVYDRSSIDAYKAALAKAMATDPKGQPRLAGVELKLSDYRFVSESLEGQRQTLRRSSHAAQGDGSAKPLVDAIDAQILKEGRWHSTVEAWNAMGREYADAMDWANARGSGGSQGVSRSTADTHVRALVLDSKGNTQVSVPSLTHDGKGGGAIVASSHREGYPAVFRIDESGNMALSAAKADRLRPMSEVEQIVAESSRAPASMMRGSHFSDNAVRDLGDGRYFVYDNKLPYRDNEIGWFSSHSMGVTPSDKALGTELTHGELMARLSDTTTEAYKARTTVEKQAILEKGFEATAARLKSEGLVTDPAKLSDLKKAYADTCLGKGFCYSPRQLADAGRGADPGFGRVSFSAGEDTKGTGAVKRMASLGELKPGFGREISEMRQLRGTKATKVEEVFNALSPHTNPGLQDTLRNAMTSAPPRVQDSIVKLFNDFDTLEYDRFLGKVFQDAFDRCKQAGECKGTAMQNIPPKYLEEVLQSQARELGLGTPAELVPAQKRAAIKLCHEAGSCANLGNNLSDKELLSAVIPQKYQDEVWKQQPWVVLTDDMGRVENRLYQRLTMGGGAVIFDRGAPASHGAYSHSLQNLFAYHTLGKKDGEEMFRYFQTGGLVGTESQKTGPMWLYDRLFDIREHGGPITGARDVHMIVAKFFSVPQETRELIPAMLAGRRETVEAIQALRSGTNSAARQIDSADVMQFRKSAAAVHADLVNSLRSTKKVTRADGIATDVASEPLWHAFKQADNSKPVFSTPEKAKKAVEDAIRASMAADGASVNEIEVAMKSYSRLIGAEKTPNGGYVGVHDIAVIPYDFLPEGFKKNDSLFARYAEAYKALNAADNLRTAGTDIDAVKAFAREAHARKLELRPDAVEKIHGPEAAKKAAAMSGPERAQFYRKLFDELPPAQKEVQAKNLWAVAQVLDPTLDTKPLAQKTRSQAGFVAREQLEKNPGSAGRTSLSAVEEGERRPRTPPRFGGSLESRELNAVLDLDGNLIHPWKDAPPPPGFQKLTYGDEHYIIADTSRDLLAHMIDPKNTDGVKVNLAVFSGGPEARNMAVAKQIMIDTKDGKKSLYDLLMRDKDGNAALLSRQDITYVEENFAKHPTVPRSIAAKGAKFEEAEKVPTLAPFDDSLMLKKFDGLFDSRNTLLLDDKTYFGGASPANLLVTKASKGMPELTRVDWVLKEGAEPGRIHSLFLTAVKAVNEQQDVGPSMFRRQFRIARDENGTLGFVQDFDRAYASNRNTMGAAARVDSNQGSAMATKALAEKYGVWRKGDSAALDAFDVEQVKAFEKPIFSRNEVMANLLENFQVEQLHRTGNSRAERAKVLFENVQASPQLAAKVNGNAPKVAREHTAMAVGLEAVQAHLRKTESSGRVFEANRAEIQARNAVFADAYARKLLESGEPGGLAALRQRGLEVADFCHAGGMCAGSVNTQKIVSNVDAIRMRTADVGRVSFSAVEEGNEQAAFRAAQKQLDIARERLAYEKARPDGSSGSIFGAKSNLEAAERNFLIAKAELKEAELPAARFERAHEELRQTVLSGNTDPKKLEAAKAKFEAEKRNAAAAGLAESGMERSATEIADSIKNNRVQRLMAQAESDLHKAKVVLTKSELRGDEQMARIYKGQVSNAEGHLAQVRAAAGETGRVSFSAAEKNTTNAYGRVAATMFKTNRAEFPGGLGTKLDQLDAMVKARKALEVEKAAAKPPKGVGSWFGGKKAFETQQAKRAAEIDRLKARETALEAAALKARQNVDQHLASIEKDLQGGVSTPNLRVLKPEEIWSPDGLTEVWAYSYPRGPGNGELQHIRLKPGAEKYSELGLAAKAKGKIDDFVVPGTDFSGGNEKLLTFFHAKEEYIDPKRPELGKRYAARPSNHLANTLADEFDALGRGEPGRMIHVRTVESGGDTSPNMAHHIVNNRAIGTPVIGKSSAYVPTGLGTKIAGLEIGMVYDELKEILLFKNALEPHDMGEYFHAMTVGPKVMDTRVEHSRAILEAWGAARNEAKAVVENPNSKLGVDYFEAIGHTKENPKYVVPHQFGDKKYQREILERAQKYYDYAMREDTPGDSWAYTGGVRGVHVVDGKVVGISEARAIEIEMNVQQRVQHSGFHLYKSVMDSENGLVSGEKISANGPMLAAEANIHRRAFGQDPGAAPPRLSAIVEDAFRGGLDKENITAERLLKKMMQGEDERLRRMAGHGYSQEVQKALDQYRTTHTAFTDEQITELARAERARHRDIQATAARYEQRAVEVKLEKGETAVFVYGSLMDIKAAERELGHKIPDGKVITTASLDGKVRDYDVWNPNSAKAKGAGEKRGPENQGYLNLSPAKADDQAREVNGVILILNEADVAKLVRREEPYNLETVTKDMKGVQVQGGDVKAFIAKDNNLINAQNIDKAGVRASYADGVEGAARALGDEFYDEFVKSTRKGNGIKVLDDNGSGRISLSAVESSARNAPTPGDIRSERAASDLRELARAKGPLTDGDLEKMAGAAKTLTEKANTTKNEIDAAVREGKTELAAELRSNLNRQIEDLKWASVNMVARSIEVGKRDNASAKALLSIERAMVGSYRQIENAAQSGSEFASGRKAADLLSEVKNPALMDRARVSKIEDTASSFARDLERLNGRAAQARSAGDIDLAVALEANLSRHVEDALRASVAIVNRAEDVGKTSPEKAAGLFRADRSLKQPLANAFQRVSLSAVEEVRGVRVMSADAARAAPAEVQAAVGFQKEVRKSLSDLRHDLLSGRGNAEERKQWRQQYEELNQRYGQFEPVTYGTSEAAQRMGLLRAEAHERALAMAEARAEQYAAKQSGDQKRIRDANQAYAQSERSHAAAVAQYAGETRARQAEIAASPSERNAAIRDSILGARERVISGHQGEFHGTSAATVVQDANSGKHLQSLNQLRAVEDAKAAEAAQASLAKTLQNSMAGGNAAKAKKMADDLINAHAAAHEVAPELKAKAVAESLRAKGAKNGWDEAAIAKCQRLGLCSPNLESRPAAAREAAVSPLAREVIYEREMARAGGNAADAKAVAEVPSSTRGQPFEYKRAVAELERKQNALEEEAAKFEKKVKAAKERAEGSGIGSPVRNELESVQKAHQEVVAASEAVESQLKALKKEKGALSDAAPLSKEAEKLQNQAVSAAIGYLRSATDDELKKLGLDGVVARAEAKSGAKRLEEYQNAKRVVAEMEPKSQQYKDLMAAVRGHVAKNEGKFKELAAALKAEGNADEKLANSLSRVTKLEAALGKLDPSQARAILNDSEVGKGHQALADALGSTRTRGQSQVEERASRLVAAKKVEDEIKGVVAKTDKPAADAKDGRSIAAVKSPADDVAAASRKMTDPAEIEKEFKKSLADASLAESAKVLEKGRDEAKVREVAAMMKGLEAGDQGMFESAKMAYKFAAEEMAKLEKSGRKLDPAKAREVATELGIRKMLEESGFSKAEINGTPEKPGLYVQTVTCWKL